MSLRRARRAATALLVPLAVPLASVVLLSAGPVGAQVYRGTDNQGQTLFTDNPNQLRQPNRTGTSARTLDATSPAAAPITGGSRPPAVQTVEALSTLEASARNGVPYADYIGQLTDTRAVVDRNLPLLSGQLRSAVVGAIACYKNAADAWAVWNASRAQWAATAVQRSWTCGSAKTAEARRYLGGVDEATQGAAETLLGDRTR
jgi:uncharacterized protein DUF4124